MQIRSARDFYDKLLLERAEVVADLTDHRPAVNAALTAWHLREWVWKEIDGDWPRIRAAFPDAAVASFRDRDAFFAWTERECPALIDMGSVANGAKHVSNTKLEDHRGDFSGQGDWDRDDWDVARLRVERGGAFSDAFSDAFATTRLENFDRQLDRVVDWWGWFLAQIS